ncbi:hypothetical protein SAMN02745111_02008 [Eubacterium uniforme]|uniref:Uncharacterized protein n=1 Tax=Eubacterium uniforme TaxID=39495 RepID=A0A1T4VZ81_9FIRM|nr:hypothetical protein [Eubacterium uniforme]SKA70332.1 hypothetical protein SAMN02745111_02008 [Eubacterium uniforme]
MKDKVKERILLDLVQQNKDIINFYSVSKEEKQKILEIISTAEDNKTEYVFPDFVFDNGFIEHFQITSSHTNRNGSYMERKNAEVYREFKKKMKEADEKLSNGEKWIESFSVEPVLQDKQSYSYLIKSFKDGFEKHLESLEKYEGIKEVGIFLIEYSDSVLRKNIKNIEDLRSIFSYGDVSKNDKKVYMLSKDIDLLKYVFTKKEKVDYIIFVNRSCVDGLYIEVIKTEKIIELVDILKDGYIFYPINLYTGKFSIGVKRFGDLC